ncbi:MAG TPA: ATP-binding protein [Candidatus Acidoferrales bacterium]|nr:ATP-binding protein [Candidatus Acidoferrales bacterium]
MGAIRSYGIATVLVGFAFVATLLVRGLFPYPFLFLFFAAVMASAWLGGTGAGLFAVLLSTLVVAYFFVPPFYSWSVSATDGTYFASFILCALVASWVSSSKKKSEEALKEARNQLEIRVAERTVELQKSNAELRWTIQEHDKAQEALRETQTDLAHLSRVFSMGELTSSIAHEISQPLTAVVTHGHACLEWLSASPPNVERARRTTENIIQDGTRAGAVLGRIRSLFKKESPTQDWLEMNEVIGELTIFLRDEASRRGISIRTDLASDLPRVKGDRVQLQQVVLNLLMNGMDAMGGLTSGAKQLLIRSKRHDARTIRISVEDSGVGLRPEIESRVFEPFFTTKPQGIGMGLSISRSIVESHRGRLWAESGRASGALFQFTIPLDSGDSDA